MLSKTEGETLGYVPVEQLLAMLAPIQRAVYIAIHEFWAQHQHAPTYAELSEITGTPNVGQALARLERAGLIVRQAYSRRSVYPVELMQVAGEHAR